MTGPNTKGDEMDTANKIDMLARIDGLTGHWTLEEQITYWTNLRTSLRREARLSLPGTPSHDDRLAEVNRITRRLDALKRAMGA